MKEYETESVPLYAFFLDGYKSLEWSACELLLYFMGPFFLRPLTQREVRQGERKQAAAFYVPPLKLDPQGADSPSSSRSREGNE
jgi:hypothetical protein